MKKNILVLFIILSNSFLFGENNKTIIEEGNKVQKQIFDKYFNENKDSKKTGNELLKNVSSDVLTKLYDKNKSTFEVESKKLKESKNKNYKNLNDVYKSYEDYITSEVLLVDLILNEYLVEKDDIQPYSYTNRYTILESFLLNMNTILEGEKNTNTVKENVETIMDYYYYEGDKLTKQNYIDMTNIQLKSKVNEEFLNIKEIINKKRKNKVLKDEIVKMEKKYNDYDKKYEEYVSGTNLNNEDKENIKKLVKFQTIANLKFLKEILNGEKGENNG